MKQLEISQAILYLKPNSEFTFLGEDYSTIVWNKLDGDAPTFDEVEAAIIVLKDIELAKEESAKQAKETAKTKLEALGLTLDDIKALGL